MCMCVCVGVVAFKQTSFTSERPGANWRIEHGPGLNMGARGCTGGWGWGWVWLVRDGIQGGGSTQPWEKPKM